MTSVSTAKRPLVCALAYDQLCMFEFGICVEVFGIDRPELGDPIYDFNVVSIDGGRLRSTGGIYLECANDMELLETADIVLIPGWKGVNEPVPDGLIASLQKAYARGAKLVSICSGVFVLARCGLLKGHRATTHWRYIEALKRLDASIHVEENVLYIDEGNILTSAGSAAGLDLCLHIVRCDYGAEIANAVARRLVLPAHRAGGQAQFVPRPMGRQVGEISPLLDLVTGSLHEEWKVARMANAAGLSSRTLLRRFKDETGLSPKQWLLKQRLLFARDLLETTTQSVENVAFTAGFQSAETLRHHFRHQFRVTPTSYRAAFQAGKLR